MRRNLVVVFLFCMTIFVDGQSDLGGSDAPDGEYPYQAALRKHSKYLCGASIINHHWLLTAAHCALIIKVPENATIAVGTNKVTGTGGDIYRVSHLIIHPLYDKGHVHANDIALVRTILEIKYNKKVKPIPLPEDPSRDYENETAILAGWGKLTEDGRASPNLQHVKLRVYNHQKCVDEWREKRNRDIIDSQICTTGKAEPNLVTRGDSGGPLVSNDMQIGVGSFAWKDLPDVFTRVDKYLVWIHRYIS